MRRTFCVRRALDVHADHGGGIDFFDQLDLAALEQGVQGLDVGVVEVEVDGAVHDLGVGEHADLAAASNQAPDLLTVPKLSY